MGTPNYREYVVDSNLRPVGYQQIISPSASIGLVLPTDKPPPRIAVIQVLSQNVRWRDDGNAPTSSVGMQLAVGNDILYTGDLDTIRFIEESAGAEININYYS